MTEIALALTPLLLLLASLLLGHYPGCDAIVRFSERFSARLGLRSAQGPLRPSAHHSHAASGGLLIALGLAQRPPPPAL